MSNRNDLSFNYDVCHFLILLVFFRVLMAVMGLPVMTWPHSLRRYNTIQFYIYTYTYLYRYPPLTQNDFAGAEEIIP